jgi:hypothetical protein
MDLHGGKASYHGTAVTTGQLVIKGTIVLSLPSPFDKKIDLGDITLPVPAITQDIPFGDVDAPGTTDGKQGIGCPASSVDGGLNDGGVDETGDAIVPGDDTSMGDSSTTTDTGVDTGADATVDAGDDTAPPPSFHCLKPSDCGGGTPYCCATIAFGAANDAGTCGISNAFSTCTAQCTKTISPGCNTTDVDKLCASAADCPGDGNCCTVHSGGVTASVCVANFERTYLESAYPGTTCVP